jgi:hypothetical protein
MERYREVQRFTRFRTSKALYLLPSIPSQK